jgi:putative transposase
MIFALLVQLLSVVLDLLSVLVRSDREEDLEIALLRQQIRQLQRARAHRLRLSWWEKLPLALLAAKLIQGTNISRVRLGQSLLLFTPETVLRWHRELVRRTWTIPHRRVAGRPRLAPKLEALIVRLAKENPCWGYSKIEGALIKLGYGVARSTIRDAFKCHYIPGSPSRAWQSSTWRTFLRQHQQHLPACDFFTGETLRLKTVYVLFFIEIGTRRIHPC